MNAIATRKDSALQKLFTSRFIERDREALISALMAWRERM